MYSASFRSSSPRLRVLRVVKASTISCNCSFVAMLFLVLHFTKLFLEKKQSHVKYKLHGLLVLLSASQEVKGQHNKYYESSH